MLWTRPRPELGDVGDLPVLEVQPEPTTPAPTTPAPTTPIPTTPTGSPDLVITDFGANTFTVKNQGTGAAGASTARVNPSTKLAVPALAAGVSTTITWRAGSSCPEGTWLVSADVLGQVAESNESNNTKTLQVIC